MFLLHPGRLINGWNILIMEVWKIMFLSKWVIWRFHVNLPGCKWRFFSRNPRWVLNGFETLTGTSLKYSQVENLWEVTVCKIPLLGKKTYHSWKPQEATFKIFAKSSLTGNFSQARRGEGLRHSSTQSCLMQLTGAKPLLRLQHFNGF